MKKIILVAATLSIVVSMEGCVNHYAKLQNPDTSQELVCSNSGWGWIGAPLAMYNQSSCVEGLQEKGFKVVEEN